jgi:large subunit ribosomal protein L21
MHAVIETGGKQYKVKAGDLIKVEKLGLDAGAAYTFDKVLAVLDDAPRFGAPYLDGASVNATVVEEGKHKKVIIMKFKRKKSFKKKKGHRQPYTALKIDSINA